MCYSVYSTYGCGHNRRGETYECDPHTQCRLRGRPQVREIYSGARCSGCLEEQNPNGSSRRVAHGQAYDYQNRNYYTQSQIQRNRTQAHYNEPNRDAHRQGHSNRQGYEYERNARSHHIETAGEYYVCDFPCCINHYHGFPTIEALQRHQDGYRRRYGY